MTGVRFPEEVLGFYAYHYVQNDYGTNSVLEHFSDSNSDYVPATPPE
jgi:hypothetical protein